MSQRVDEQIESGLNRNLSLFEDKLTEALSSLRNTVESVVSAVSGLENRDNIEVRDRVHTPIANITPERRTLGGSLNDVHRPIDISVWRNGNTGTIRQTSVPDNQDRLDIEPHGEAVHHTRMPEKTSKRKLRKKNLSEKSENGVEEPEQSSSRLDVKSSISDRDFEDITKRVENSLPRRIKIQD